MLQIRRPAGQPILDIPNPAAHDPNELVDPELQNHAFLGLHLVLIEVFFDYC